MTSTIISQDLLLKSDISPKIMDKVANSAGALHMISGKYYNYSYKFLYSRLYNDIATKVNCPLLETHKRDIRAITDTIRNAIYELQKSLSIDAFAYIYSNGASVRSEGSDTWDTRFIDTMAEVTLDRVPKEQYHMLYKKYIEEHEAFDGLSPYDLFEREAAYAKQKYIDLISHQDINNSVDTETVVHGKIHRSRYFKYKKAVRSRAFLSKESGEDLKFADFADVALHELIFTVTDKDFLMYSGATDEMIQKLSTGSFDWLSTRTWRLLDQVIEAIILKMMYLEGYYNK